VSSRNVIRIPPGADLGIGEAFEVVRETSPPGLKRLVERWPRGPESVVFVAGNKHGDALTAAGELDFLAAFDVVDKDRQVVASFGDRDLASHWGKI